MFRREKIIKKIKNGNISTCDDKKLVIYYIYKLPPYVSRIIREINP